MSSISEDYFTFEEAVDDWNTSHKDKLLSPETAKTLNLGKEIFVQFNEKTGFRITEGSFWSRFQDHGLSAFAKKQLALWKVLGKEHYHAYTILTNPFAPSAEKEKVLSNALKYCQTIPPTIPQKEKMIFLDFIIRKYLKSKSSDFDEDFIRGFIFLHSSPSAEEIKNLLPNLKEVLHQAKSKINAKTEISYIEVISQFETKLDLLIRKNLTRAAVTGEVESASSVVKRIYHETLDASPFLSTDIDISLAGFKRHSACQSIHDQLVSFKKTRKSEEEQKQLQQLTNGIALAKKAADVQLLASQGLLPQEKISATVTKISRLIQNLKTRNPPYIILVGGSSSHTILYKIAWDSSTGNYRVSVINTGGGAEFTRLSVTGRLIHAKVTNREYANIPIEKLNSDFISRFFIFAYEFSSDQVLKSIDEHLGKSNRTAGKEHIGQYRGTCTAASQLAWLREEMDPQLYAEFETFMAERNLALLDEEIKAMSQKTFKLIFPEAENKEETLKKLRDLVVYSLEESQRRLREGISESTEIKRLSEGFF